MKTPEQIADEVIETKAGGKYPDDFKFERALIVAAINADRAQRADLLLREAGNLDFYREHMVEIVKNGYVDTPDGERYKLDALDHNLMRAAENMRLAAEAAML